MRHFRLSQIEGARKRGHLIRRLALLGVLFGASSYGALAYIRGPQTTAVTRGKVIANQLGCFGCHGPGGTGGPGCALAQTGQLALAGSGLSARHGVLALALVRLTQMPARLRVDGSRIGRQLAE